MKNSLLIIFFIAITMKVTAQSDYDCIGRDEFYILKTGSDMKSISKIKASELKSSKTAEQLFGTKYKDRKYVEIMTRNNFTEIVYDDGLRLEIPENSKSATNFDITSDKYTMILANGQVIRVGMNGDDLKAIFPKSYSKRSVVTDRESMKGKTTFIVYFSFVRDNKVYIETAWIIFVLSKENGALEEFFSFEPE